MKIVTATQMQALDRRTIMEARVPSLTLMERAGAGTTDFIQRRFGPLPGKRVTVICGKGNNGGDGFVVARLLRRLRANVTVVMLASPAELSRDAAAMYRRWLRVGGTSSTKRFQSFEQGQALFTKSDVLVDALFGTGLSAPLTGTYREAVALMNEARRPIVAIDMPSGIHADDGTVLGDAVKATATVTFGLPKLGLYLGAGIDHAGLIHVVDIGIPAAYVDQTDSRTLLITKEFVKAALPARAASAHKGTFGHAGILAGSVGKTGAAALAAKAALRTGAGLVTVGVPASVNDVLEAKLLEAMTLPLPETKARTLGRAAFDRILAFIQAKTAVAIGPGLSTHPETVEVVQSLMKHLDRPSVLDADALNALASRASLLTECKTPPILTPHPGEMARLEVDATPQSVNADRLGTARRFARERGVFLVLKGARTVVARPDGILMICPTGNPGMATAGTGDALTGMLVSLLAQGVASWEAACAASYLHGTAGDLAAARLGPAGMIAGDLIEHIPYAIQATAT
ncbi:MAG TPA: NAD(P)H-hydrate dehydratase [Nitrospira sp.]|nr:NAD(P)H-hydrate dehydratase [Nitrospira sp.]